MGVPSVGDIVVLPFPFSDGSGVKRRPALVLAEADDRDVIVCQVTSRPYASRHHVKIGRDSFSHGSLPLVSFARPEKLFTASRASLGTPVAGVDDEVLQAALSIARALFGHSQN